MFSLGKGFPPSVGRGRVPQRALAQLPALECPPPPRASCPFLSALEASQRAAVLAWIPKRLIMEKPDYEVGKLEL